MRLVLLIAVGLLSFANGANDNFKGVSTLWGARCASYRRALGWATGFTLLGSLLAVRVAADLVSKFNGSALVSGDVYTQVPFLIAVSLGAAVTVLAASRAGLPVSTTHALTGALVGAGVFGAGVAHVKLTALGSAVALPLLLSPIASLGLTLAAYPAVAMLARGRDCVCIGERPTVAVSQSGTAVLAAAPAIPVARWAPLAECRTGAEAVRWRISEGLHWLTAAAISFARGLNDTPKIAALLLAGFAGAVQLNYALVALAIAIGGLLGAARVAWTLSKEITPMEAAEAAGANFVAAALVILASGLALPVSTTHVTAGSLFGIGLLRRGQADWGRVREILFAWLGTLPLGAALAISFYWLMTR